MACRFARQAMRQAPALWAFFAEFGPDEGLRERALAEFAGWLYSETRLFGRTREAVGSREAKLMELAAVAMQAWDDLQPGEPFYLPNRYTRSRGEQRRKRHLAGRAGGLLDGLPELCGLSPAGGSPQGGARRGEPAGGSPQGGARRGEPAERLYGASDDEIEAYVEAESRRSELSEIIEKAKLSAREAQVIEQQRRGAEAAQIAAALGIELGTGHISEEELDAYLVDLKNQTDNLRLLLASEEARLSQRRERAQLADTTEAWLTALRERVEEVEEDTPEAFEVRRRLAELLVQSISAGRREEDGRTEVRITYRFGPPPTAEPSLEGDEFVTHFKNGSLS